MLAKVVGGNLGILNPSTDPSLDCSFGAFGAFKPACWVQASNEDRFRAPPPIAPSIAPSGSVLTYAPASGAAADATVNALISQGVTASQAQQQGFFQSLDLTPGPLDSVANWWQQNSTALLWIAGIGAGLFVLGSMRRR